MTNYTQTPEKNRTIKSLIINPQTFNVPNRFEIDPVETTYKLIDQLEGFKNTIKDQIPIGTYYEISILPKNGDPEAKFPLNFKGVLETLLYSHKNDTKFRIDLKDDVKKAQDN